jgi:RNA polymerase sigma factor (sigma-70 family)
MTSDSSPRAKPNHDAPLDELSRRAGEIRDAVRARVLASGDLRAIAASGNETAEDVAQSVFLKLWGLVRDGDREAIRDLKAYAKKMADNHIASLGRRTAQRSIRPAEPEELDRLADVLGGVRDPEHVVERHLSAAQVESILDRLTPKQRLLLKMRFELGMKVPEMTRVVGGSRKACEKQLEKATEKVKDELAAAEDFEAADRRRLSRVMAVKRWGTPALVAGLRRDMRSDLRLASLWRQSNGALHDVAGAVGIDESLRHLDHHRGLGERALIWVDRAREAVTSLAGRPGAEHEAAAGAALGGGGAATKVIVAACIAGPAAAGVGGACVATGVVDLPTHGSKTVAERNLPEPPAGTTTTPTVPQVLTTPLEDPSSREPATTVDDPVPPADKELLGSGSSKASGSAGGSRDFVAPVQASTSSGGGGGGNTGGSRENFGP